MNHFTFTCYFLLFYICILTQTRPTIPFTAKVITIQDHSELMVSNESLYIHWLLSVVLHMHFVTNAHHNANQTQGNHHSELMLSNESLCIHWLLSVVLHIQFDTNPPHYAYPSQGNHNAWLALPRWSSRTSLAPSRAKVASARCAQVCPGGRACLSPSPSVSPWTRRFISQSRKAAPFLWPAKGLSINRYEWVSEWGTVSTPQSSLGAGNSI